MKNTCVVCGDTWHFDMMKATYDEQDKRNIAEHGELFSYCEDCNGGYCESAEKPEIHDALAQYAALQHQATVYVPTTLGTSGKASEERINTTVEYVAKQMSDMFGGFTIERGKGGWNSAEEGLVTEHVYMVRSNSDHMTVEDTNKLVSIAKTVKRIHEQEAVSLDVDGKLYFI